ncbi:MAG: hypothetical protein HOB52_06110, partial [Euryarchaeota archaeon]|nr:hypothetical protein [Euryarchaeota archaeon]
MQWGSVILIPTKNRLKFTSIHCLVVCFILLATPLLSLSVAGSSIEYNGAHSENQFSTHSYSSSLEAAYDGSNSSYAFLVVRGCDGQSCTSVSFLEVEYDLVAVSTPNILEFEWNIQPYDSFTPVGSVTNLSFYDHNSATWTTMVTETGTLSGWELVTVNISAN